MVVGMEKLKQPLGPAPIAPMNPEIKQRWTTALRSGEYEQGRGALATGRFAGGWSYCCLGVLCEIAVADGVIQADETGNNMKAYGYGNNRTYPPDAVRAWAGLPITPRNWAGSAEAGSAERILARKNDSGSTFEEIAQWIEENL